MERNIKLMDGATGTRLWELAEQAGVGKDPVWLYNLTHPEFVRQAAREYIAAGSTIICSNTFGANAPAIRRHGDYDPDEVVRLGVRCAREAAAGTDARVALDIGPLMELMEPYGELSEEEAEAIFARQMTAGMAEGAELIFLETFMDREMLKAAVRAAKGFGVPVLCSMTFEKSGRTMMGDRIADIVDELEALGVDAVGLNCSLGPGQALPVIREFARCTTLPLIFKPNAGVPGSGEQCSAEDFAREAAPALALADYVGACCGSDPEYIRALRARL